MHTPGPWHYEETASGFNWLRGPNGETIFHVDPDDNDWLTEADAHLIEAAPELLETLRLGQELVASAYAHISHGGPTRADAEKWLAQAKWAMTKAGK